MTQLISVVIPVLNESQTIQHLVRRLAEASGSWNCDYEIIFIDDGSTDNTLEMIKEMHSVNPRVKYLSFSRNFGQQTAVSAGLEVSAGDAVVIMDADLQDPPEEIQKFIDKWKDGYDVVYGIRHNRKEGLAKKMAYWLFYRTLNKLASIRIPLDAGDFSLISRPVVNHLNALPERNRFVRGLRSWVGFRQTGVLYERAVRYEGDAKYGVRKLVRLALDGIFSFSHRPLKIIGSFGFIVSILSFAGLVFYFVLRIFDIPFLGLSPKDVPGFTSIVLILLFVSGVQILALGIFGEYLGRIFDEVKRRPQYIVKESSHFGVEPNNLIRDK